MVVVRPDVVVVAEGLAGEADRWTAAYEAWQQATRLRGRKIAQAERRVMAATEGLGLHRWEAACRRTRIFTAADAKLKARAIRARSVVMAAMAERDRVNSEHDAAVLDARLKLAEVSKVIGSRGTIGAALTGLEPADLRRLARRPRTAPRAADALTGRGVPTPSIPSLDASMAYL